MKERVETKLSVEDKRRSTMILNSSSLKQKKKSSDSLLPPLQVLFPYYLVPRPKTVSTHIQAKVLSQVDRESGSPFSLIHTRSMAVYTETGHIPDVTYPSWDREAAARHRQ